MEKLRKRRVRNEFATEKLRKHSLSANKPASQPDNEPANEPASQLTQKLRRHRVCNECAMEELRKHRDSECTMVAQWKS